jgi:proteic killer suppression protein
MEIYDVELSPQAKRDLRKVPAYILDKFEGWVKAVEREGLRQVQRIPGYHDEPLKGKRSVQRSIRLNKAYRAVYILKNKKEIEFLWVEEVNKHEY